MPSAERDGWKLDRSCHFLLRCDREHFACNQCPVFSERNEILREIYKEVRGAYDEYSSDFCRWCRQPDAQQGATQAVSGNVQQAVQQVKK